MKTKDIAIIALFAALTAVGSLIKIPLGFTPVPITLQVFFVLFAGLILGPVRGALALLAYLVIGAVGIPVFAGGTGGFQAIVGPSGGYLYGFVIAAFVVGLVARSIKGDRTVVLAGSAFLACIAGVLVIYVFGAGHMMLTMSLSPAKAFALGVAPFIPVDFAKAVVVTIIYVGIAQRGVLKAVEA
ncbi:hypothetical protein LCGC14_1268650 [marine sediment metagenome]|uniref:Biotin transporter n=1 Tax=marine sediment metagenome TaxID=412755 RepID=A0A0F9NFH0_9ZZZZ